MPIMQIPRQPQQARSRATRRRVLDSAVACLVGVGYARTTTTEVCRRAKISQGALFKHFPSKAALLGATIEHLYSKMVREYERALASAADSNDRVGTAIRLLWETFSTPALYASLELVVAARTDRDLRKALGPVLAQHGENLQRAASELFPDAASGPDFHAAVSVILAAMQGAAVSAIARPDAELDEGMRSYLERTARSALAGEES